MENYHMHVVGRKVVQSQLAVRLRQMVRLNFDKHCECVKLIKTGLAQSLAKDDFSCTKK